MRRKYFKSLKEAKEVVNNDPHYLGLRIFKKKHGYRKGWYLVCTEIEFLNTY